MDTARQLKKVCPTPFIFRAGVWKPRTNPDTFQGAGEEALEWLQEVQHKLGLSVATEVALPEHVDAALQAGIDYLWIGARTSANPIAVQTLCEQLMVHTHRPKAVLIKNPVNADAALWLGNIERLERAGVQVMAVHRGCNHAPCWFMAHAVRTARPDIPLLLDPSHMSGDAAQIAPLLDKAATLDYNGAMIEVHVHPEEALSDTKQQITPLQLHNTLNSIVSRKCLASLISASEEVNELSWLRAEIDELDDRLWDTIAARMEVSKRIGEWKKAHGVAPLQPERYQQILTQRCQWATKSGMDAAFVEEILQAIHTQSLKQQE